MLIYLNKEQESDQTYIPPVFHHFHPGFTPRIPTVPKPGFCNDLEVLEMLWDIGSIHLGLASDTVRRCRRDRVGHRQ